MKIKSGAELDWGMVLKAAKALVKLAEDSAWTPPEALDLHLDRVRQACVAMDSIVDALKLRHGSGAAPTRVVPK